MNPPPGSTDPAASASGRPAYPTESQSARRLSVPGSASARARPSYSTTSRYWKDVLSPEPPQQTPLSSLPPHSSQPMSSSAAAPEFASLPVLSLPSSAAPHHYPHHHQQQEHLRHHPHLPHAGSSSSSATKTTKRGTATRQFHCSLCPSRFERRGHLEAHVETVHEGKRPHRCPRGCGKVFGHRSSLHRHIKTVHDNPMHRDSDKHSSRKKQIP